MRALSQSLILAPVLVAALSTLSACSHASASEDDAVAGDAAPASTCRQEAEGFCTREYKPTRCVFHQQEFSSSNPCETKKLVRAYACENNVKYADDQVKCDSHGAIHMKNEDKYSKPQGTAQ